MYFRDVVCKISCLLLFPLAKEIITLEKVPQDASIRSFALRNKNLLQLKADGTVCLNYRDHKTSTPGSPHVTVLQVCCLQQAGLSILHILWLDSFNLIKPGYRLYFV